MEYAISAITLNVKSMISTEVAELAGKKHFHVLRDIEVILEQLVGSDLSSDQVKHNPNLGYGITDEEKIGSDLGRSFKATEYKDSYGRNQKGYELDYEATMIVVTGYDVVARAKVIRRWLELEQIVVVKESPTLKLEMDLVFAKADQSTVIRTKS